MVCGLAEIRRSKLDEIIVGYKAVCQEQKHQGTKIQSVIIVGTTALKA